MLGLDLAPRARSKSRPNSKSAIELLIRNRPRLPADGHKALAPSDPTSRRSEPANATQVNSLASQSFAQEIGTFRAVGQNKNRQPRPRRPRFRLSSGEQNSSRRSRSPQEP